MFGPSRVIINSANLDADLEHLIYKSIAHMKSDGLLDYDGPVYCKPSVIPFEIRHCNTDYPCPGYKVALNFYKFGKDTKYHSNDSFIECAHFFGVHCTGFEPFHLIVPDGCPRNKDEPKPGNSRHRVHSMIGWDGTTVFDVSSKKETRQKRVTFHVCDDLLDYERLDDMFESFQTLIYDDDNDDYVDGARYYCMLQLQTHGCNTNFEDGCEHLVYLMDIFKMESENEDDIDFGTPYKTAYFEKSQCGGYELTYIGPC